MISTECPPVTWLRTTIETHILDIRNAAGELKESDEWPGRYLLPTGDVIPAVYVVGSAMVPSEWNIDGIECTIQDVPEIFNPGSACGVVSYEKWVVRFTNYGFMEGTKMPKSLLNISRRLARTFPRDESTYMARTEATFESLTARILGPYINPPIP